jgi:hypothetical protein
MQETARKERAEGIGTASPREYKRYQGGEGVGPGCAHLPGGFGARRTCADFAVKGADCVRPARRGASRSRMAAKKPSAQSASPGLIAEILGREYAPEVTIGKRRGTSEAINRTGSRHVECPVTGFVVDRNTRLCPPRLHAGDAHLQTARVSRRRSRQCWIWHKDSRGGRRSELPATRQGVPIN